MQVIEKVKVVPEGYNGAGMNYDGGNRRDVNGKANAGLTLWFKNVDFDGDKVWEYFHMNN